MVGIVVLAIRIGWAEIPPIIGMVGTYLEEDPKDDFKSC